MLEEKVSQPIQVFHLHISSCQHIWLFVVLNETNSNVCFLNCHFVSLLRYNADHVSKLSLDSKLSNGSHNEFSLHWGHRGAYAQTAQVAKRKVKLFQGLVTKDEVELRALEKKYIWLFDSIDVSSSVLKLVLILGVIISSPLLVLLFLSSAFATFLRLCSSAVLSHFFVGSLLPIWLIWLNGFAFETSLKHFFQTWLERFFHLSLCCSLNHYRICKSFK